MQGLGFMIAFLGRDLTWELIAALVATIGEMILVPFSQALRADLMDGDQVGTYTGAFSVTQLSLRSCQESLCLSQVFMEILE